VNKSLLHFFGLVLLAAVVLAAGLLPIKHVLSDKAEHILVFTVIAFACHRSQTPLRHFWVCVVFLVLAAIGLEFLQKTLSDVRTASWRDVFASCVGIVYGLGMAKLRGRALLASAAILPLFAIAAGWGINHANFK